MKTIYKTTCARLMTLLVLALLSVSNVWGEEANLTLSSTTKFGTTSGSTLTDNQGNTWTCTGTSIQNSYQSAYSGQQFGTGSTDYSYTFTSSISGTITSVSITAAAGGTAATYDISVGGTSFKSEIFLKLQQNILQQSTQQET